MKSLFWVTIIFLTEVSCRQKHESFQKIYFVAYNRPLNGLPDDFNGQPPILINSFVEIRSDGVVINGNRKNGQDTLMHFYESTLPKNFLDSLSYFVSKYDHDKSFLELDPNGAEDSYFALCLLVETRDKNTLIEFLDSHSIPVELNPIVINFWKLAQEKHPVETTSSQFYSFQKKLDEILLKRSKLLPPPIKTIIKFLPPKVDSIKK